MLSPPIFDDEVETRAANSLHLVILILLALTFVFTIDAPFTHSDPTPILLTSLILTPLLALGLHQIRQGNVRSVSILLITFLWLFFAFVSFASGGVRSPSTLFFISISLITALTLGRRASLIVTGLSALATLGMVWAEINNIAPPIILPTTLLSSWSVLVGNLIITTVLLIRAGRILNTAIRRAQNSENHYRAIIEDQTEFIVRWLPDGTRTFVNEAYCRFFEQTRDQLLGTSFLPLVAEADRTAVIEKIGRLTPEHPAETDVHRSIKSDGTIVWQEWIDRGIFDDKGELIKLQSVGRDVTDRIRVEQALNARQRELESLLETSSDLSSTLALDTLLELIAQRALSLLDAVEATIFQLENNKTLRPLISVGKHAEKIMTETIAVGEGLTGYAVQKNQPILVNDVQLDSRAKLVPETPINEREHLMVVPLTSRGQTIGAMFVNRLSDKAFTKENLHFFIGFSHQAAIALENARIYEALESQNVALEKAVLARTTELQRTTEQIRTILNNSPDAILSLTADGAIETINPAFQEMFGCTLEKIRSQKPISLVAPHCQDDFSNALQAAVDGGSVRLEVTAQTKNESNFDADIALEPIRKAGEVQGIVCSIRDISPLKEVQRMKEAFVSNVSHELRSPITSINLSLKLLELKPDELETYVARITRETKRLADTVEDLLQLSRLDENRLTTSLEAVDLKKLTAVYIADRQPMADHKQITLQLNQEPGLPVVHADKGLLGQVLSILLTNAFDYAPIDGRVLISTRTEMRDGRLWAGFSVSDNGPGILPEEQELIFERFSRGSAGRQSSIPGTGLGLALALEILNLHDGRIAVESSGIAGEGAKFSVWLPTEPAN